MVIDVRVQFPDKEALAKLFGGRAGTVAEPYGAVYTRKDYEEYLRDSEVVKGATVKEAILGLFDGPPERFLKLMDDVGVSHICVFGRDTTSVVGGAKVPSEKVLEVAKRYPGRVIPFAGADPYKGMEAVREFEHAIKEYGFKGLAIPPWENGIPATDRRMYPFYAKCIELNVPVRLHASINFGYKRNLELSHPLHIDQVANDLPELKILAAHGGWPWVNDMVAVCWKHRNVYVDIGSMRPRYIGMAGTGWEPLLVYGNTIVQDQILWGSGWPNQPWKRPIEEVRQLPLKESVKEKWLYKNAARLFGIEGA